MNTLFSITSLPRTLTVNISDIHTGSHGYSLCKRWTLWCNGFYGWQNTWLTSQKITVNLGEDGWGASLKQRIPGDNWSRILQAIMPFLSPINNVKVPKAMTPRKDITNSIYLSLSTDCCGKECHALNGVVSWSQYSNQQTNVTDHKMRTLVLQGATIVMLQLSLNYYNILQVTTVTSSTCRLILRTLSLTSTTYFGYATSLQWYQIQCNNNHS